jgi:mannose-6-phosphate isomerase-like protein (cupin superfamily)
MREVRVTAVAAAAPTAAEKLKFSMRNLPLLEGGATMELLGLSPMLWAHSKVYSAGGENALHMHDIEDHLFFVLQGKGIFHFADGSSTMAGQYEGVMVPRGTLYRFHADESLGNLVMLRVGAANIANSADLDPRFNIPREALTKRSDAQGKAAAGDDKKNGTAAQPTVVKPGAFFAPD